MFPFLRTSLLAALLAATTSLPCGADDTQNPPPAILDATVKLSGGVLAAGVGYKWGHGTLTYQGNQYNFCAHGLSVGDVGIASVDARGNVYNLKSLEDFSGKYFALSGGFAIVKGGSGAILKNKRGVMVELQMLESGLRFSIAASGLKIVLVGEPGCKAK